MMISVPSHPPPPVSPFLYICKDAHHPPAMRIFSLTTYSPLLYSLYQFFQALYLSRIYFDVKQFPFFVDKPVARVAADSEIVLDCFLLTLRQVIVDYVLPNDVILLDDVLPALLVAVVREIHIDS